MQRKKRHAPIKSGALPAGIWTVAMALIVTGCIFNGGQSRESGTHVGEWQLLQGDCSQRLVLESDGDFAIFVSLNDTAFAAEDRIIGTYDLSTVIGQPGYFIDFTPAEIPAPDGIYYCEQWQFRQVRDMPFAETASTLGYDPRFLHYREEGSTDLGKVLVGTSDSREERFALYISDNALSGFDLSGAESTPLYAALRGDLNQAPDLGLPWQTYDLPRVPYRWQSIVTTAGDALDQFVLNIVAAADVTFSVGSPPHCHFEIYEDLSFPPDPILLLDAGLVELRLNPADPNQTFVTRTITVGGKSATAYLLPMVLKGDEVDEVCDASIRAVSSAVTVLEEIVAQGGVPDFTFTLPEGSFRAVGVPHDGAHRLARTRFELGVAARGFRGFPVTLVSIPLLAGDVEGRPPAFDALNILGLNGSPPGFSAGISDDLPFLNIYPDSESPYGLGPFAIIDTDPSRIDVSIPSANSNQFLEQGQSHRYGFELNQQARIAIFSNDPLDTIGKLFDVSGRLLAADDDGSTEGNGFKIVRTLVPGIYTVEVTSGMSIGSYSLRIEFAGSATVQDEELEACLLAAGVERLAESPLSELVCIDKGVTDLTGLAGVGDFLFLELAGNLITDLSPLQSITTLRVLSLVDNPVSDLDPLVNLPLLRELYLSGCPITIADLETLQALKETLVFLDVSDTPALVDEDLMAFIEEMPYTKLILPSGQVAN